MQTVYKGSDRKYRIQQKLSDLKRCLGTTKWDTEESVRHLPYTSLFIKYKLQKEVRTLEKELKNLRK